MKSRVLAVGLLLILVSPAYAQSPPSIQQQLSTTLKALGAELAHADQVVARMRALTKSGPAEAKREFAKVATTLGRLADRLEDQGDVMGALRALATAAKVNRERVAHLAKGTISETDRSNVLQKWTTILQQVDGAQARVKAMRDKILSALSELRMRQVGISEEILAGSYEDAIKSLNEWLDDLEKTIGHLRTSIGMPGV